MPIRVRLDQNLTESSEIAELIFPPDVISNVGEALSDSAPAVRVSLLVAAPAQDLAVG
jgi:hypothetical protein